MSIDGGSVSAATNRRKIVGKPGNFWLWSADLGFDLTHPPKPDSPSCGPSLYLPTSTASVTIAPAKTALIIIDMQNFFLSRSLGRSGPCHDAEKALLDYGIPAARKAGIQIIWLTWGLNEHDMEHMDPVVYRIFGFQTYDKTSPSSSDEVPSGEGLGGEIGEIQAEDGTTVEGGRLLFRDMWNTALHPPLEAAYRQGLKSKRPDVRIHKNRISGMCDAMQDCTNFLNQHNIKTLIFTGVNTDQCVLGTLQDANLKGFDTILLKDGCGTTSPDFARQMTEYNCAKSWGFVSTCRDLAESIRSDD